MELLLAFSIFLLSMGVCLLLDVTMLLPLGIGFVLFAGLALRRGFSVREVLLMAKEGLGQSLIVVGVLLLIGCMTGLWRASGTIAYFVSAGVRLMPPRIFLLAAFLLAGLMSLALGTSFGVSATCGVILMAIARAGGISPVLTAGAVMSGVYIGDRGSPAASSGNLVAAVTGTDMRDNVPKMMRSAVLPILLCCVLYGILSLLFPVEEMDLSVLEKLDGAFTLRWVCLIPAVLMLVLPLCRVPVKLCMALSIAASLLLAVTVQDMPLGAALRAMLLGYDPADVSLAALLSGGGLASMLEVSGILLISGTYGSIFAATGLLDGLTEKLRHLAERWGRYPLMVVLAFLVSAVFCNQTIAIIMQSQLTAKLFGDTPEEREDKMLCIENSTILIAGLVPWCIACSVPLGMMEVGIEAIPFSFYLYLLPLCCLIKDIRKKSTKKA